MRVVVCLLLIAIAAPAAAGAEPVRVVAAGGNIAEPRQPQAAVDDQGRVYVAFGSAGRVYCSVSSDRGKSFGAPVMVGEVDRLALGARRGPRIAAAGDAVVITAAGHAESNLLAWRSTDRGQSWQGPVRVNDVPGATPESLHAMAAGPKGELFCVWLDLRDRAQKVGNQIVGSRSTDGGATWSANQLIYRSPSGTVCECCHPAVTYDGRGGLYVMWRNSIDGSRDMYAVVSRDGGKSFGPAVKLGTGTWRLPACPMDGGYVAVSAAGQVTTVWRRDRQVFYTRPGQAEEQLLGEGEQPWAAADSQGAWLVWTARGDVLLMGGPKREPEAIARGGRFPVVAAAASGKGPVVAVWEAGSGSSAAIFAAVVNE